MDEQHKVYVQDKILEQKDLVWKLLQEGAIIYICGEGAHMAPDVRRAFTQICAENTGKSELEATAWMEDLDAKGRYLIDVWAAE